MYPNGQHHHERSPQRAIINQLTSAQPEPIRHPLDTRVNRTSPQRRQRINNVHGQAQEFKEICVPRINMDEDESSGALHYNQNLQFVQHFHERFGQEKSTAHHARPVSKHLDIRAYRSQSLPPLIEQQDSNLFIENEPITELSYKASTYNPDNDSDPNIAVLDTTNEANRQGKVTPASENREVFTNFREEEYSTIPFEPKKSLSHYRKKSDNEETNISANTSDDINFRIRGAGSGKKVSYAAERENQTLRKNSPVIACRLRSEYLETDDSDVSFTAPPRSRRSSVKCQRAEENFSPMIYNYPNTQAGYPLEEYVVNLNTNNNDNIPMDSPNQYSYESMPGAGSSSNGLYRDVLPLPIELPDNVSDVDAFRRYLTVRRGAIRSDRLNIPFEKRNRASYESLGRRHRRSALGMSSSRILDHDASRRTASLSHAIMTLALLSASICQLRFLMTYSSSHSYPILNYILIFTSIILEIAAGIGFVIVARCSFDDAQSEAIHNYLIFALFLVAASNVVLAAFAFDGNICEGKAYGHTSTPPPQDQQINQLVPRSDQVMDLRYMPLE